jgi:nucleoside-diphosphate-sugar epimerase
LSGAGRSQAANRAPGGGSAAATAASVGGTPVSRATIAVTGAGGFIGSAYAARLVARGQPVRQFVRQRRSQDTALDIVATDLARTSVDELARRLDGVIAVVHLAGRAHMMNESAAPAQAPYTIGNVGVTERVARASVAAGVRRFVFASTVKVNGEATLPGEPFRPGDAPAPRDQYAQSKLAAERVLAELASGTSMLATSLRLPLVYGAGARGNFRRLVDAVAAHRVLPFGAIDNRRSLLRLDTLLDALDAALGAEPALTGTHFVADADSVSTPALVRAIAAALGVAPRLVPVPLYALRLAGALSGRGAAIARLIASLEVDTVSFARASGWRARAFGIDASMVAPPPRSLPGAGI